jgi:hypothetical protein
MTTVTAESVQAFALTCGRVAGHRLPVHEFSHWVADHQPEAQKEALAKKFFERCDVSANIAAAKILEEPLAVVHQKLFLSAVDPERFEFASSWYGDPWVGTYAKLIYPQVKQAIESGRKLDDALMKSTSKTCAQLKALAASFR